MISQNIVLGVSTLLLVASVHSEYWSAYHHITEDYKCRITFGGSTECEDHCHNDSSWIIASEEVPTSGSSVTVGASIGSGVTFVVIVGLVIYCCSVGCCADRRNLGRVTVVGGAPTVSTTVVNSVVQPAYNPPPPQPVYVLPQPQQQVYAPPPQQQVYAPPPQPPQQQVYAPPPQQTAQAPPCPPSYAAAPPSYNQSVGDPAYAGGTATSSAPYPPVDPYPTKGMLMGSL